MKACWDVTDVLEEMEGKSIVAVCGHPLLYDTTLYLFIVVISDMVDDEKTQIVFANSLLCFWCVTAHLRGTRMDGPLTLLFFCHCRAVFTSCLVLQRARYTCLPHLVCCPPLPSMTPSISLALCLFPPSPFRSPEQWACGGGAIWAQPAVPSPSLIPP